MCQLKVLGNVSLPTNEMYGTDLQTRGGMKPVSSHHDNHRFFSDLREQKLCAHAGEEGDGAEDRREPLLKRGCHDRALAHIKDFLCYQGISTS